MSLHDLDARVPDGTPPRPLDRVLRDLYGGAPWSAVRRLVESGKVTIDDVRITDPTTRVAPGASIRVSLRARRTEEHRLLPDDALVYVDAHVAVVRKPAGMATVPFDDERDTLDRLARELVHRHSGRSVPPLGVVQRLDRETSGLIVFARTLAAKRSLQGQLRAHTVHRRYVALASGQVRDATYRSRLVADRGDGKRGSTRHAELGRESVTHVRSLEPLQGATLVECRLETGRTHQIRIHLAEAGHPLLGERVYGDPKREKLPVPRLMLHAAELGFEHPHGGRPLFFSEPLPDDFAMALEHLRRSKRQR